jgi:biotin carboxylase
MSPGIAERNPKSRRLLSDVKVLLVAATTGYQVRTFASAARKLGIECVLATDRCHVLEDPWADRAIAIKFDRLEPNSVTGHFDGIVAVGDKPALVAAQIAEELGISFHSASAVRVCNDKHLTREALRDAGMLTPEFSLVGIHDEPRAVRYPCVLKALHLSASRGVIRANNDQEYRQVRDRIAAMRVGEQLQVEAYIPGEEFALEGLVREGRLQTLAIFAKPDPLVGPFFEETIYVTTDQHRDEISQTTQAAVRALGLKNGPVHAEMRVNDHGVWMLEVAARPIGGLCAGVARFEPGGISLEELILRHAIGEDPTGFTREERPAGVMMIPVPAAGILENVSGVEDARAIPGIDGVVITAKVGHALVPLPEGASYPGFLFAHADTEAEVVATLKDAHAKMHFQVLAKLPVRV